MSRVQWDGMFPRDPRDAFGIGSLYTGLHGVDLDHENFADDGLDRRALDTNAHVDEGFTPIEETTRASLAAAAVWTQYAPNGTAFRSGAITIGSAEVLCVRLRAFFKSTAAAANLGLGATADLEMRLVKSTGGGTKLTGSYRRKLVSTVGYHGWIGVLGWVEGPVSLSYVEAQYKLTGTAFPSVSVMDGLLYKRV